MGRRLGNLERQLFAYAHMRNTQILHSGDLCGALSITPKQENELFSRLSRASLIAKVRRGLYLIPARLPLGSKWTPNEALALNTLMEDKNGTYQVCGLSAFNHYGFSEQIPVRIFAYNNKLSGDRKIGAVSLTLIKVADERLGDTDITEYIGGDKLAYSSKTRTLIDAVYDWSRFASIPQAYTWIQTELSTGRVTGKDLVCCALQYGNQGTIRRLGVTLEMAGIDRRLLIMLEKGLRSSKSQILWIPSGRGSGKLNRRWGVIINEPI